MSYGKWLYRGLSAYLGAGLLWAPLCAGEFIDDPVSGQGLTLKGSAGCLFRTKSGICFDSSRSKEKAHRWGASEAAPAMDGDLCVEADFRIDTLDHWNSFGIRAGSDDSSRWQIGLLRLQEDAGRNFLQAKVIRNGEEELRKFETAISAGTLRLERHGTIAILSVRPDHGEYRELCRFENMPDGPGRAGMNFDSPPGTAGTVEITGFRLNWDREAVNAFPPCYGDFRKLATPVLLQVQNGNRNADGSLTLQPGGRAFFATQSALSTRSHTLRWRSAGALRIAFAAPDNAETLKLSDVIVNDGSEESGLEELKAREHNFEAAFLRFPAERNWPLPHFSDSNILFYQVTPGGDEPVRITGLELWGHELEPGAPFKAAMRLSATPRNGGGYTALAWSSPEPQCRSLSGAPLPEQTELKSGDVPFHPVPLLLNAARPSAELVFEPVKAGKFEILHAAGRQEPEDSAVAAAYLIVYEDGTTETIFATLRWNCGVYQDGFLPGISCDTTWWGPPAFSRASTLNFPAGSEGLEWRTLYHTSVVNPHPEKAVRSLIVCQLPGDRREFLLAALTIRPPESTVIGLVEPDNATFAPGDRIGANVYEYRSIPAAARENAELRLVNPGRSLRLTEIEINRSGRFGAGRGETAIPAEASEPGPVELRAGTCRSSQLGLMPPDVPGEKPFYYTMIAGGAESPADFDRIRRNGYDAVKIHLPWVLDETGKTVFPDWPERFEHIRQAGLKIAFRNLFPLPEQYRNRVERHRFYIPGRGIVTENDDPFDVDTANELYCRLLVDYYRETARLAVRTPGVIGINANYGQRCGLGYEGRLAFTTQSLTAFRADLAKRYTLAELNSRCGLSLNSFDEITPEIVWNDRSRLLLPVWTRLNEALGNRLIREIAHGIRDEGFRGHLTFNVTMHPVESKFLGQTYAEYLRVGRELPPASLSHETSDRYCLSFLKWLAAARTCGLPYGDEGNQPPPTYEHNIFSFLWMAMMQCHEANYCQWYGGKPAHQNIAWLKPYHKLLYQAEYLPDPVTLALSLQSGHAEAPDAIREPLHSTVMAHYGLANTLRELNINADRYLIDEFPELDKNVKSRLLIDDLTRSIPQEFGDRIEEFIRKGGVFLASLDTDRLNGYAFFRRFGVEVKEGQCTGPGVRCTGRGHTVSEKRIGRGKLAILNGTWENGWNPASSAEHRRFFREQLTRLGGFEPLAATDSAGIFVTPYRAANGDLLLFIINLSCVPRRAAVDFAGSLVAGTPVVSDLGSGRKLAAKAAGNRWRCGVDVEKFSATVLRVSVKRSNHAGQ